MPRRSSAQLNIRLESEVIEILNAAVYVRRLRGPQELISPLLRDFAAALATEPGIQAALRGRQEADAQAKGKLKSLTPRGGRNGAS